MNTAALLPLAVATANAADCDRTCLIALAENYYAALVAHDSQKAPLARDIKTVENAKRIRPGEGLWKTITAGPGEFKIVVPDPVSQQVGGMVVCNGCVEVCPMDILGPNPEENKPPLSIWR